MGIDIHALKFLNMVKLKKALGDSVTIGRQGLHLSESTLRKYLKNKKYKKMPYCEELLLEFFSANSVVSIDNSSYEQATFIHDMNEALPDELKRKFDTILDFGTTEHIFDVKQALSNYSLLCKPGGQIIHILPANNFCGHGFWQFSPEVFFSFYSPDNGFKDTEVYISSLTLYSKFKEVFAGFFYNIPIVDSIFSDKCFKVKNFQNSRLFFTSSIPVYVMVRTVLADKECSNKKIQQSDYVHAWKGGEVLNNYNQVARFNKKFRRFFSFHPLKAVVSLFYKGYLARGGLNSRNHCLEEIKLGSFFKK
jgi:hypothetical protein